MVTWLKQIFGLNRYFVVVYMYQLESGTTGQGQATAIVSGGYYVSPKGVRDGVDSNLDGEVKTFFFLNVIELNKRDHKQLTNSIDES